MIDLQCFCCSQSVEDVGLTKIDGYWTCDECASLDDYDLDIEEYEERKRQRIAEENEY